MSRTALLAGSGESKVRAIVDRLASKATYLVKDSSEPILSPLLARPHLLTLANFTNSTSSYMNISR